MVSITDNDLLLAKIRFYRIYPSYFYVDPEREIFRLVKQDNVSIQEVVQQYGVSRSSIYRIIATFERENPLEAELMKKQGKDVTPEDYKKLLEELSSLKKALAEERLRADFYQEMVAYGEEVYGIKLKKAGTK